MGDVQSYLNEVTSEFQGKPNFMAMLALDVGFSVNIQVLLAKMLTTLFDLDTPPVGDQLDIIGQWVGVSRDIRVPITGVFLTWDSDDVSLGWDAGTWFSSIVGGTQVVSLPDDAYLVLIRGKIGANNWDGTTTSAYKIYAQVFPGFNVFILDKCNMTYEIAIVGGVIPALTLALLTGGYIPLKPEGVRITNYLVSVDTNPAFSWDSDTATLKGWNEGSWLKVYPTT